MSKRIILLVFSIVCFIPLQIYFLLKWLPKFLNFSGGIACLELRFSYNGTDVYNLLNTLGEAGIHHYITGTIIDMFYAFFMAFVVFNIYKVIQGEIINKGIFNVLSIIIPAAYLCFDWMENIGILIFLYRFPLTADKCIPIFSFFTMLKQLMPIVAGIYLLIIILIRIIKRLNIVKNHV